jgi:Fe-S oxidoreductase
MMYNVFTGCVAWFFSCPTVLAAVFVFAVLLTAVFSIVGFATRED